MTGWVGHLLAPYTRKEVYYKDKELRTSSVKHLPVSFWTDAKTYMCDAAYQQQKSHRCRITNWMSKLDFEHYRWSVDSVIKKQYELFLGNSFVIGEPETSVQMGRIISITSL